MVATIGSKGKGKVRAQVRFQSLTVSFLVALAMPDSRGLLVEGEFCSLKITSACEPSVSDFSRRLKADELQPNFTKLEKSSKVFAFLAQRSLLIDESTP